MNLTEALDELGIDYRIHGQHHHVSEGWVGIDCPLCSPHSGHYRCGINLASAGCSCWSCGPLQLAEVLAAASSKSYYEVKQFIPYRQNVYTRRQRDETPYPTRRATLVLPSGLQPISTLCLPCCKPHRAYLLRRGFDPTQIAAVWGVQGVTLAYEHSWSLFIPIADASGKVVSWTTRRLSNNGRRYVNAKAEQELQPIKSVLYGAYLAKHAVIVVEGPTDAWRIGPGAVAVMGVAFTQAQVAKIAKYPVRCIVFDNEPNAQQQAKKLCNQLAVYPGQTHLAQLRSKDPGEATNEEVKELRRRFLQ